MLLRIIFLFWLYKISIEIHVSVYSTTMRTQWSHSQWLRGQSRHIVNNYVNTLPALSITMRTHDYNEYLYENDIIREMAFACSYDGALVKFVLTNKGSRISWHCPFKVAEPKRSQFASIFVTFLQNITGTFKLKNNTNIFSFSQPSSFFENYLQYKPCTVMGSWSTHTIETNLCFQHFFINKI